MNQTPLSFVLDDGKAYGASCSIEVWFSNGKSGLDKKQLMIQLIGFGGS